MLDIERLTKRYGEQFALAAVSFSARAGEILGVIGPNGAGKTTLLEAIAGVLPADGGEVRWRGVGLSPSHRREAMFYLPDGVRPWQEQHALSALEFIAGAYRRSRGQLLQAATTVGLEPVLGKRIGALSKGFARRLMWAFALLAPQPLLLMDEPFDGFDLRQAREMTALLRGIAAGGRTLVLSIHQLADAEKVCDRFVLLGDGRVRGVGTVAELRARSGLAHGALEEVFLALA
jgi:ABC-type multidrug transport system ATPase subunit